MDTPTPHPLLPPPPPTDTIETGLPPPTKTEVLETLDWEIRTARDEGTAIGTSTWSLALALGAVLWLLSSQASYSWPELPALVHLFIGFSLVYDLLDTLYHTAGPTVPKEEPERVRSAAETLDPMRRRVVFETIRRLTVVGLVLSGLDTFMSTAMSWTMLVWYGVFTVIFLLVLLMEFLVRLFSVGPTPNKRASAKWERVGRLLSPTVWILPLVVAGLFWVPIFKDRQTFRGTDYTSAALIVLATFLVRLLLDSIQRSAKVPFLIPLRRDLAFGIIGPEEAARRARLALSGLTVDEFVKKEFDAHKKFMTDVNGTFARTNSSLGKMETDLQAGQKRDLTGYLVKVAEIVEFGSRLEKNHTSFLGKLEALPEGAERNALKIEADKLIEAIRESRAKTASRIERVRGLISSPSKP